MRPRTAVPKPPATPPATPPAEQLNPPAQLELESARETPPVDEKQSQDDTHQNELAAAGVKKAGDLTMGPAYDRVIDTLFDYKAPNVEFDEIVEALAFKGKRASERTYAELIDALDVAESMAFRAARLLANAKVKFALFEIDATAIEAALREETVRYLKALKPGEEGRTKAITEKDVESTLSTRHNRDYVLLHEKLAKAKRSIDVYEALEIRASERAKDLRQIVARARTVD